MKTLQLLTLNVEGRFHVSENGVQSLTLTLASPKEVSALSQALGRALNTWDTAPSWLVELADALEAKLPSS